MYVKELTVRYRQRRVTGMLSLPGRLTNPRDAAAVLVPILRDEVIEVCGLLCLSTQTDILAYYELSRGTLDSTIVHPRDVFRIALLANAATVVVGHNHPSGDPTPSPDDRVLTQRLKDAGTLIGIPLTDHVIVVMDGRYFSFREAGRL
ncbi:MAG TPA: JAB domain-containing protein [Vicinamibacterales bacterium]|nr:JAB domain-containing protein [Vicinamibacterales bacterium]